MKIVAYYIAIVMLILLVGALIYRLLFGAPCTIVGNYCVGDGWSIAGLAATILGVAATVLGILGAFALAAWWTNLDDRVRKQVDTSLKQQEETLNKRVDDIVAKQELKITTQFQEDLTKFSEKIAHELTKADQIVHDLGTEMMMFRSEYEKTSLMADNARRLAVDMMMLGHPWNIDSQAMDAVFEYEIVDITVIMVYKYLRYVEDFLSGTPSEKTRKISDLKKSGAPSTDLQWFWERALYWQKEVNRFSMEHPEIVKQVNDKIESYQKRIDEARQNDAHEV